MLKTQPRISRVPRSQANETVASIYDRYMKTRGNIPNMFRTMAHRPEIFATMRTSRPFLRRERSQPS